MNAGRTALHRFACLTAASAFFLIAAGGMVTSTGSGLAVPDWPLSFGQFFPPMVGGVFFEHGHRMIAGAVGLMTLALALWTGLREDRRWVRLLAFAAAGAILVQAVLGGVTVLMKLPPQVSIAHACLGQIVFCLLLSLAQATSPWFESPIPSPQSPVPISGGLWRLGALAAGAVFIQLFLGALLRHTGKGFLLHMGWAFLAAAGIGLAALKVLKDHPDASALTRLSAFLLLSIPFQILLGFAAFFLRHSPAAPLSFFQQATAVTAHVAFGALILGASVLWTLRAYRLAEIAR